MELYVNKLCSLSRQARQAFPINVAANGIGTDDILRSYIGLLTLGQSDYEAITSRKEDDYFKEALGIGKVPSTETLRLRLDQAALGLRPLVVECSAEFLKNAQVPVTALHTGHVALDCDVFPMDNSQTQKEGVSRIYNGQDGYAPIAAYLAQEGWCLELELREGKQHSQCEFIPFLKRVVTKARSLTSKELLARLDSAHDALETRATLAGFNKVSYILKWNPRNEDRRQWADKIFAEGAVSTPRVGKRVGILSIHIEQIYEGKAYRFRRVMRAVERTIDKRGQLLLTPKIELERWWTSLNLAEKDVISLYEDHGTSEQFYSEIKSDMDLERLPSGKFATNSLILTLAGLAYNILRMIGQLGLVGGVSPVRHRAKRRRLKTVMQELMYLAARLVKTGRCLKLLFSRHCPAFASFQSVYGRLACG